MADTTENLKRDTTEEMDVDVVGITSDDEEDSVSESGSDSDAMGDYVDNYLESLESVDRDKENKERFVEARLAEKIKPKDELLVLDPKNATKLKVKRDLQAFQEQRAESYQEDEDIPFPTSQVPLNNSLEDFKTPDFIPKKRSRKNPTVRKTKDNAEWAEECKNIKQFLRSGTFPSYFSRCDRFNLKSRANKRFRIIDGQLKFWYTRSRKHDGKLDFMSYHYSCVYYGIRGTF